MKIYKNLCEGWREYLRGVSLTGSTWVLKTSTSFSLRAFLAKRKSLPTLTEFEKLHPIDCKCSNNEQNAKEKEERFGFNNLNAMEKGVILEEPVLKAEEIVQGFKITQGSETILQEIVDDKPLISFNVDGFEGEDMLKTSLLYEVKTTSQLNKSTAERLSTYDAQIQFYLNYFPSKGIPMVLLLYFIELNEYSRLTIEKCPITSKRLKDVVERVKNS